jgi:hypothetical protein
MSKGLSALGMALGHKRGLRLGYMGLEGGSVFLRVEIYVK